MGRPALVVVTLVALSCGGALRHDPSSRYLGMLLDARDLGARELERITADDPVVRDWVTRAGQPDYVLLASPSDVELVYYRDSQVVLFHRPTPDAASAVGVAEPLPSSIRPLLAPDLRAGTSAPPPDPGTSCWTIDVADVRCRTCCATPIACTIDCRSPQR